MEPIVVVLIALAAISVFLFLLLVLLITRKEYDVLLFLGTLLSFFIFIYLLSFIASYLVHKSNFFTSLGFQVFLLYLSLMSILSFLNFLVKEKKKKVMIISQVIFSLSFILFISLLIASKNMQLSEDSSLLQSLAYIWIFTFYVPALILLIRNKLNIGRISFMALLAGISMMLIVPFFDQILNIKEGQPFESLIFATFICFIIITFILFVHFISRHTALQQKDIQVKAIFQVLERLDAIAVVLDRMGHVEYVNPYFYHLTGFQVEEVIGKDWFEQFLPRKEHFDVQSAFIEIIEYEHHPRYRNPILTKNKEEKIIDWHNIRLFDQCGHITGILSLGIDMTEDLSDCEKLKKKLQDAEKLIDRLKAGTQSL